mmetsp:Transcript_50659/g.134964  ORF Transcript_50659/g.134964 Transcript_50659/m.134964 type:complete len:469 (-) Transcript_50659:832-2238(-)
MSMHRSQKKQMHAQLYTPRPEERKPTVTCDPKRDDGSRLQSCRQRSLKLHQCSCTCPDAFRLCLGGKHLLRCLLNMRRGRHVHIGASLHRVHVHRITDFGLSTTLPRTFILHPRPGVAEFQKHHISVLRLLAPHPRLCVLKDTLRFVEATLITEQRGLFQSIRHLHALTLRADLLIWLQLHLGLRCLTPLNRHGNGRRLHLRACGQIMISQGGFQEHHTPRFRDRNSQLHHQVPTLLRDHVGNGDSGSRLLLHNLKRCMDSGQGHAGAEVECQVLRHDTRQSTDGPCERRPYGAHIFHESEGRVSPFCDLRHEGCVVVGTKSKTIKAAPSARQASQQGANLSASCAILAVGQQQDGRDGVPLPPLLHSEQRHVETRCDGCSAGCEQTQSGNVRVVLPFCVHLPQAQHTSGGVVERDQPHTVCGRRLFDDEPHGALNLPDIITVHGTAHVQHAHDIHRLPSRLLSRTSC